MVHSKDNAVRFLMNNMISQHLPLRQDLGQSEQANVRNLELQRLQLLSALQMHLYVMSPKVFEENNHQRLIFKRIFVFFLHLPLHDLLMHFLHFRVKNPYTYRKHWSRHTFASL